MSAVLGSVRRRLVEGAAVTEVLEDDGWRPVPDDAPQPFDLPPVQPWRDLAGPAPDGTLLPFAPSSFRDFMLFERHVVAASRGMARRYLPAAARFASVVERTTRRDFAAYRPKRIWFEQPIYYFGNALTFVPTGTPVAVPTYTAALDYELELGVVIDRPLRDATVEEAHAAICAVVVVNDLSARDVQLREMRSGFGPQKSKHFQSSLSGALVPRRGLPDLDALSGWVRVNGEEVARSTTAGMRFTMAEAIAHASRSEQLFPGELFGSGTLPGCCGLEVGRLLEAGDRLELGLDGIGAIVHDVVAATPGSGS
ncbi:fumarylacetoacetate hydrolase family protein [Nocardioides sp.]|uniref:fumarylacetoacetate hydrolase family protein n=1 Tax=Nocardioides sp. TaxID=35761 RepID=UPI0035111A46